VLEKDEDVVGRTRDQRRVCGARGRRDGLSLWRVSVRVSYERASHCASKFARKLYRKLIAVWVLSVRRMSYTPGPSNAALLPIRAGFRGVAERLAKVTYSHTATPLRSHRSSVSSDKLQLSCFKLGVRVILTWHF
jgi:hypothetical protein